MFCSTEEGFQFPPPQISDTLKSANHIVRAGEQFNHDARNDWWVFHVVSSCPNNGLAAMAL